jgi:flagellar basal-body rod protein FlgG
MVKGLYTAYTGLVNQQNRLDVISNNLANATTVGYKKEGVTSQSFDEMMAIKVRDTTGMYNQYIGDVSLGVKIGETYTDYEQGSFRETGENFDLALGGEGFFSISYTNKAGTTSTMYTRDGNFSMTKDGYLVTKDGDYVLGEGGIIQLPTDASQIAISQDGTITADGVEIDKLALVDFEDYNYLQKYGENLYKALDTATVKDCDATVYQGYLEQSNVNVVTEMVEMITISRAFEANQKAMNAADDTLQKAVTLGQL